MDIEPCLKKLAELEQELKHDCLLCLYPDGSGFVMKDKYNRYVLEFDTPQESLIKMQSCIDLEMPD